MNSERKAQFLRRAENRRLRSIARELRRSRQSEYKSEAVVEIKPENIISDKQETPTRLIKKSSGGCGSCGKKATRFKEKLEQEKTKKVETSPPTKIKTKTTTTKPVKNIIKRKTGLSMPSQG